MQAALTATNQKWEIFAKLASVLSRYSGFFFLVIF
jgi:hypothetical protein